MSSWPVKKKPAAVSSVGLGLVAGQLVKEWSRLRAIFMSSSSMAAAEWRRFGSQSITSVPEDPCFNGTVNKRKKMWNPTSKQSINRSNRTIYIHKSINQSIVETKNSGQPINQSIDRSNEELKPINQSIDRSNEELKPINQSSNQAPTGTLNRCDIHDHALVATGRILPCEPFKTRRTQGWPSKGTQIHIHRRLVPRHYGQRWRMANVIRCHVCTKNRKKFQNYSTSLFHLDVRENFVYQNSHMFWM